MKAGIRGEYAQRQPQSVMTGCKDTEWGDTPLRGFKDTPRKHGMEGGMCWDTLCSFVTMETGGGVVMTS